MTSVSSEAKVDTAVLKRREYYRQYYQKNKKKIQASTNAYKKRNPNKVRQWAWITKYGLTKEQYEALGSSCWICGSTETLCVDHCHETKEVRGLLCRKHNLALGHFEDNIEHIAKALEYLNGRVRNN